MSKDIKIENKCVVKIAVSGKSHHLIEEVIYFRSGMSVDFVTRWSWYFEYLAALVKVANPRIKVELYKGPQDVMLGKEWHEHRREALLKSRKTKLKKLSIGVVDDDLFHFKSQDNEKEKQKVQSQIEFLIRDEYPIAEFPEYRNKIKKFLHLKGGEE